MSNVHQDFGCPKVSIRNRNAKENWVINVGEFVAHLLLMTWVMLPRRKRKENILVSRWLRDGDHQLQLLVGGASKKIHGPRSVDYTFWRAVQLKFIARVQRVILFPWRNPTSESSPIARATTTEFRDVWKISTGELDYRIIRLILFPFVSFSNIYILIPNWLTAPMFK